MLESAFRRIPPGRQITVLPPVFVEIDVDFAEDDTLVAEDVAVAFDAHHGARIIGTHGPPAGQMT